MSNIVLTQVRSNVAETRAFQVLMLQAMINNFPISYPSDQINFCGIS